MWLLTSARRAHRGSAIFRDLSAAIHGIDTKTGKSSPPWLVLEHAAIGLVRVMNTIRFVAEKIERMDGNIVLNQYVFFGTEPQVFKWEGYDYVDLHSRPLRKTKK